GVWHAQPRHRISLKIKFDHHHGFVPDHPTVVTRFDRDHVGRFVLDDAAVGVLDVDLAVYEEADVRVHAEVGAGDGFHVFRPSKAWRINHPLHPGPTRASDVEP